VIREVSRKEYVEKKPLLAIAFTLVLCVTAAIPFVFTYSLKIAYAAAATQDTAQLILANFRSYAVFVETEWLARNLARILSLLALIAGAGAIAGEREARTLPLLYTSALPLRSIAAIKFCVIAAWLFLVTFASFGVLTAHSLVERLPLPIEVVAVASVVAFANAMAFLAVVFAASSLMNRTIFAAILALVLGFGAAGVLHLFGLNGTALATNIVAVDGSVIWRNAWLDVLVSFLIVLIGLLVTFIEVDRRRAA
jgi:ABC-type transport system involved in multi-copper enzyme maturation permease subunit